MSSETKECPYCAETIKAKATVCRFCRRELTVLNSQQQTPVVVITSQTTPQTKENIQAQSRWMIIGTIAAIVAACIAILPFVTGYTTFEGILSGFSSGPSDAQAINLISPYVIFDNNSRNVQNISKGKCGSIPSTAQAQGISEAWLVNFTYEYRGWASDPWITLDHTGRIVKRDGIWEYQQSFVCP